MFDNTDFQTLNSRAHHLDANTRVAPVAPVNASLAPTPDCPSLVFPCTLKDVAERLAINYDTLRNKWIGKIEALYEGLDCDAVRDASRKVTPFGFQVIESYVKQVDRNGTSYEAYRAMVHASFASKLTQTAQPATEINDMVPYQPQHGELERFMPPARKLRQFVSTAAFVTTAKQHTATALDVTQSNSDSLTAALVNQMEQEGQKLGLTLFQAKYGTAHTVMADLEETLAKKSGLVEATPPPPAG